MLRLQTARRQSLGRIGRKSVLLHNYLMQVVFKEVGATRTAVSIVNRKVTALRPLFEASLVRWPRHIQNDGDSILIVVPLDALMGVRCVRSDQTVCF